MITRMNIRYWLPRILIITVLAVFFIIPAVATYSNGVSVCTATLLIETIIFSLATAIAWKWPKVGGVLLLLAGSFLIYSSLQSATGFEAQSFFTTELPILVSGALFMAEKAKRRK